MCLGTKYLRFSYKVYATYFTTYDSLGPCPPVPCARRLQPCLPNAMGGWNSELLRGFRAVLPASPAAASLRAGRSGERASPLHQRANYQRELHGQVSHYAKCFQGL